MRNKIIIIITVSLMFALSGCSTPKRGIDLYSPNEFRPLHVEIKTNDQSLKISYSNFLNSDVSFEKSFSQIITTGNFTGKVNVPRGQKLFISANDYDEVNFYTRGSAEVKATQNSITANIEILEVRPALTKIISTLSEQQKRDLINIVGLYDETIRSPRILVSQLHSKAQTHLGIFYRGTDTKYTELWSYFSRIDSLIDTTTLPNAGGGTSYADVQKISQAGRMLSTVLSAI